MMNTPDEDVEQHAELDQERHALGLRQAEEVDAVLEHQVADDLRERLAPRGQHDEADHHRRERHRHEQLLLHPGQREARGDGERERHRQRTEQQRGDESDQRLDLAPHRRLANRPAEEPGQEDRLHEDRADAETDGV